MMIYIDTHAHLYSDEYKDDIDAVINDCLANNVSKILMPSIDSTYYQRMDDLKQRYPDMLHLMIGIHPTHVDKDYRDEIDAIKRRLATDTSKYVGVGEIGIDTYWGKENLIFQREAFIEQIGIAKQYDFPINIHCRDAFDEVFEVLESERDDRLRGIFHCFTGNLEQARYIVNHLGLMLGIGGVVTFKNGGLDRFLNEIDITNIILETDSPYLSPSPYRGKRNTPAYIPLIADKLSQIYGLSTDEIARITTANVYSLYKTLP